MVSENLHFHQVLYGKDTLSKFIINVKAKIAKKQPKMLLKSLFLFLTLQGKKKPRDENGENKPISSK